MPPDLPKRNTISPVPEAGLGNRRPHLRKDELSTEDSRLAGMSCSADSGLLRQRIQPAPQLYPCVPAGDK
jgi:hypothetical protein